MALVPISRDSLSSARGRALSILAGFTTGQKVMTVLAVVGAIVAAVVFMGAESKPTYQPLFTNLQSSDAGAITQQLASQKVPYQLADGGSTILVPAADVDQERVALAQQGLPQAGNVGFSNLEKSGITTSEFVQQVEYQQALEGQLEQTISSIQGVQSAQVNLVVPQQSEFAVGTQQATTASILVNLAPGTVLSSGQVSAVVHLAASSVPGLSSSNVTVVDNHGDVLTAPGDAGGTSGASNTQQTNAYDTQLAASLTALLARVVGEGNAAVQVNALLNFNQSQTTTNGLQLNAQGQPVTAPTGQNTSNSTYSGTGTPPSGVLGSGQAPTTTGGNGTYSTTSSQITNAVGQVTQTVKQAPGQVERTSVAVLLNSSKKVNQAQVRSLVTAAAGLNTANGDQLVVTSMRFASSGNSQGAAAGAASASAHRQLLRARRRDRRPPAPDRSDGGRHPGGRQAPPAAVPRDLPGRTRSDGIDDPGRRGTEPDRRDARHTAAPVLQLGSDAVLAQVNQFVEQRPAEAAHLLKSWADEREEVDGGRALPV